MGIHITRHFDHHARFYLSAGLGLLAYMAMGWSPLSHYPWLRTVLAGDGFFLAYLAAMTALVPGASVEGIREKARKLDESAPFIFLLTGIAAIFGLTAIFTLLHVQTLAVALRIAIAISTVALAWLALHIAAAFHYAHLFYANTKTRGQMSATTKMDAEGLAFPGEHPPLLWDFFYFSFVVGMTAQVSDVQVTSPFMRRFVLLHGILSFFFNTVILALAVNVAAGLT